MVLGLDFAGKHLGDVLELLVEVILGDGISEVDIEKGIFLGGDADNFLNT